MKKVMLLFIAVYSLNLFSQGFSIKWSSASLDQLPRNEDFIFKSKENHVLYITQPRTSVFKIVKIDKSLNVVFNKELNLIGKRTSDSKNFMSLMHCYDLDGRHIIITKYYNFKEKLVSCIAFQINDEGNIEKETEFMSISDIDIINYKDILISNSQDKSKLLIYRRYDVEVKNSDTYYVGVFENTLSKIWEGEIVTSNKNYYYEVRNITVGNNGDVYTLTVCYKNCSEMNPGKDNCLLSVNRFDKNKDRKSLNTTVSGHVPLKAVLKVNDKGELINYGFIAKNYESKTFYGVYSFVIDPIKLEIKNSKVVEFNKDNYIEFMNPKKAEKAVQSKDGLVKEFELNELNNYFNEGQTIISEMKEIYSYDKVQNYIYESFSTCYFGKLSILKVNENGEIDWMRGIIKMQQGNEDALGGSYKAVSYDDKLLIFWCDTEKNIKKQAEENENKSTALILGTVVNDKGMMAILDKSGNIDKQVILDGEKTNLYLQTRLCTKISNNEILIFAYKMEKFKVGILTLK